MNDVASLFAPEPGLYEHYKGNMYFVFKVAIHTETNELMVFYRYLYDDYGWTVRPLVMFMDEVTVAGVTVPRFRKIKTLSMKEQFFYLSDDCKNGAKASHD